MINLYFDGRCQCQRRVILLPRTANGNDGTTAGNANAFVNDSPCRMTVRASYDSPAGVVQLQLFKTYSALGLRTHTNRWLDGRQIDRRSRILPVDLDLQQRPHSDKGQ